jgi:probable F420-dependent oxidoreductase
MFGEAAKRPINPTPITHHPSLNVEIELKLALFGLHRGSSVDPEVLARRARRAEEVGFESLWVGDHIALPFDAGDPPEEPRLEALVALTYLAALTTRVRLAVGVIVLPQRQPVLLAKQLASLDVLSQGRLTVGIGVGYVEPELRALGASLADRSARTDEYLAALRALWDEPVPSFAGRFVSFADVIERPRPIQRPHPPIVIGGHSPSAYRRAIQTGNGWYGWELDLEQTAQALAALREAASRYERPAALGALEITITPRGLIDLETARRYADLGVHRLAFQPHTMAGTAIDELITSVGETLIGRV